MLLITVVATTIPFYVGRVSVFINHSGHRQTLEIKKFLNFELSIIPSRI